MKTTESLTTLLHARADARLQVEVHEKFDAVWQMFEPFKGRSEAGYFGPDKKWIVGEWVALRNAFVEVLTPHYREKELVDFMNRVGSLANELDELRQQS